MDAFILSELSGWAEAAILAPMGAMYATDWLARRALVRESVEIVELVNFENPFGLQDMIDDVSDLINCVSEPDLYGSLTKDNEILVVGPPQSGKDTFLYYMAQKAGVRRVMSVYAPHNDAGLIHAIRFLDGGVWERTAQQITKIRPTKTLLHLPGLNGEPSPLLEALIKAARVRPHIMIGGTTTHYDRNGKVATLFGTVRTMPQGDDEDGLSKDYLRATAEGFLGKAKSAHFALSGFRDESEFIEPIVEQAINVSEIKDTLEHCQRRAIFELQSRAKPDVHTAKEALKITPEIRDRALNRAILGAKSPAVA